jgi:hypothetical protein
MVLPDRIELSTSPLPMECSTTELRQHARYWGIGPNGRPLGGRFLPQGPRWRKHGGGLVRGQIGQKTALAIGEPAQVGADPVPGGRSRRIRARMASSAGLAVRASGSRHQQAIAT